MAPAPRQRVCQFRRSRFSSASDCLPSRHGRQTSRRVDSRRQRLRCEYHVAARDASNQLINSTRRSNSPKPTMFHDSAEPQESVAHIQFGTDGESTVHRKPLTAAQTWLAAGAIDLSCQDSDPTAKWNIRVGCFTNETCHVLGTTMTVAIEAPQEEDVPWPSLCCQQHALGLSSRVAIDAPEEVCVSRPSLCKGHHVRFDLSAIVVHEITPYSEIYGSRPRTFVFDRDGNKIPAAPCGFVSLQSWHYKWDDADECDEQ